MDASKASRTEAGETAHQFLDSSELRLRVRGRSLGQLATEAGRALGSLILGDGAPADAGPWREIAIDANDPETLLVDWLNELIFLAESEGWLARDFEVASESENSLRVRARGIAVDRGAGPVKAATLHGIRIERTP